MFITLSHNNQRERDFLLASLAQQLLPQPRGHVAPSQNMPIFSVDDIRTPGPGAPGELKTVVRSVGAISGAGVMSEVRAAESEAQLLQEIQHTLRLDPQDRSAQAHTKILAFLSEEMSQPLRSSTRMAEAKARLGDKGYLPYLSYRLIFQESFRESERLGIKRSHVEDALKAPDLVQHLRPDLIKREGFPALSIYLKSPQRRQGGEPFTLLITTERTGDTQTILSAWRIYHAEVDTTGITEPLAMLRAFLAVYGVPCRVGNSSVETFFLYEVFPVADGQEYTKVLTIEDYPPEFYTANFFRVSPLHVVEASLVYVVNLTKYIADLQKHHVHVVPRKVSPR